MAHTKAQKAVSGNRDSKSKRLGVKIFGDQKAYPGNIILRQRGTRVHAGAGTIISRDFTIVAVREGKVKFGLKKGDRIVSIV